VYTPKIKISLLMRYLYTNIYHSIIHKPNDRISLGRTDKENVVHIPIEFYSTTKNEIMPCARGSCL
jgi:hypothetical protein